MDCRWPQKRLLRALLGESAYPTAVAVHGASKTGKTTTLREFLAESDVSASWVECDQCATARVLLQRALRQIFEKTKVASAQDAVAENVDVFYTVLKRKFKAASYTEKHVLVLDRIDELPDYLARADLFSSLSRLPELTGGLRNLVVVFVFSTAEPRQLVINPGVPHIWFPRYTSAEAVQILQSCSSDICVANADSSPGADLSDEFKAEYLEVVVKALAPYAGTDIAVLKRFAQRIWPEFVRNVSPTDSFARVYVAKARLFQLDSFVEKLPVPQEVRSSLLVSPLSSYLLCAAYLASYNPPRYDMRYFSQAKTMRNKRRETKPKKSATIPPRSLAAPDFEMERLLAIFHALNPRGFDYHPHTDLGREIATLTAQNLLIKSQNNPLDSRTKWKINVPWSYVQRLAQDIALPIEDYLVDF